MKLMLLSFLVPSKLRKSSKCEGASWVCWEPMKPELYDQLLVHAFLEFGLLGDVRTLGSSPCFPAEQRLRVWAV